MVEHDAQEEGQPLSQCRPCGQLGVDDKRCHSIDGMVDAMLARQRKSQRLLAELVEEHGEVLEAMEACARICAEGLADGEPWALVREAESELAGAPTCKAAPHMRPLRTCSGFTESKPGSSAEEIEEAQAEERDGETIPDARWSLVESGESNPEPGHFELSAFMAGSHSESDLRTSERRGTGHWRRLQVACEAVLQFRWFEPTIGVLILLNAANIGVTIDMELRRQDTSTQNLIELVFLVIFVLEVLLRFIAQGFSSCKVAWNLIDFILIFLSVVSIMLAPLLLEMKWEVVTELMNTVLILRTLRLLRLARAMRLVSMWSSLWKLVQGMKQSLNTMLSALLIMVFSTFLFACFGAEFVTKAYIDDPEIGDKVAKHFSDIPKIMLTLVQFITQDSIAAFYVPIIHRSPALAMYFVVILVFVSIALMNLITALLVQDAISNTQMDIEMKDHYARMKLKRIRPAFRQLFRQLDDNGDGLVQAKELFRALKTGIVIPEEVKDVINPGRLLDLFDALDRDQSGDLTEDEFMDGLSCVATSDVPPETMQILHLARSIRREVECFAKRQSDGSVRTSRRTIVGRSASGRMRSRRSVVLSSADTGDTVTI